MITIKIDNAEKRGRLWEENRMRLHHLKLLF